MTAGQTLAGYRFATASGASGSAVPILALHKTGSGVDETIALVREIAPSNRIIAPEGNVREGERRRFFARHADGSFDVDDLVERARALVEFVEALPADTASMPVLFGISHGANIAAAMLLQRPDLFFGAVLIRLAGLPAALPSAPLLGRPVLLISGSADQTVPEIQSTQAAQRLVALGAVLDHHTIPAGHAPVPQDIDIARDWMAAVMASPVAQTLQWRH